MTPRESARVHLPQLDAEFDELRTRFGATLEHLVTPDGTWGADPTEGCPRLPALPWPAPWTPPGRLTR